MLLKKFAGEEGEEVDVQKLFGYVGLFTLVALWWLGKPLLETFIFPDPDLHYFSFRWASRPLIFRVPVNIHPFI